MGKGRGEEGAFLHACCKSLAKYGVCKEQLWPYLAQLVDSKPSARESNGSKRLLPLGRAAHVWPQETSTRCII